MLVESHDPRQDVGRMRSLDPISYTISHDRTAITDVTAT